MSGVRGIHHVTAIAGDPQRNLDFYAGALGLRLVKRTVNFDDPGTYHFYFGDETGAPGSILTFFPSPAAAPGRIGAGQVAITSLAIPREAIGFWIERLLRRGVAYQGPLRRAAAGGAAEQVISFRDPDGLMLELVAASGTDARPGWETADIPRDRAIRGVHCVTLWVEHHAPTEHALVSLGFSRIGEEGSTRRYAAGEGASGAIVDVRAVGGFLKGAEGAGTVHHVAWIVATDEEQVALRELLVREGLDPTPVRDRTYFRSVYFREPGEILFEIATVTPGFAIDEALDQLGEQLMLPPQYQGLRAGIERALRPVRVPGAAGSDESASRASAWDQPVSEPADRSSS